MDITTHRPGTASWIELPAPDPAVSASFYSGLFGWEVRAPDQNGHRICKLRGRAVAALSIQDRPGRPGWLTYLTVNDVDTTVKAVQEAGGEVLRAPYDVAAVGRAAVCADNSRAVFAVWEHDDAMGAGLAKEPGAVQRVELETRDPRAALDFYPSVFGWNPTEEEVSGKRIYDFHLYDETIAGLMPMGDAVPAEVPPHWMVYFASADPDATADSAHRLGGTVYVPPTDVSVGRFAVLGDPQGAVFGILRMSC